MSKKIGSPPGGAPQYQEPVAAYKEFCQNLWWAHEQFSKAKDGGVEGAKFACQAVARYIAVRHENPELAVPFFALYYAVGDLQKGIVPELFSIKKIDLERSRSSRKKHIRTSAAVWLEVLIELGEPRQRAAELVARHVNKWSGLGRQKITSTTVINWRNRERALEALERWPFEAFRDGVLDEPDPRKFVEDLLKEGPPSNPKS